MAAIVLNDEYTGQQSAGRNGESQGHPVGKLHRPIHQRARADKKTDRRKNLD